MEWPIPRKTPELRSFLGLANYYKKFIVGYSKKVAPLTNLLKKNKIHCQDAFEKLKVFIASERVLKLPDFNLPVEVHIDASDKAMGGGAGLGVTLHCL